MISDKIKLKIVQTARIIIGFSAPLIILYEIILLWELLKDYDVNSNEPAPAVLPYMFAISASTYFSFIVALWQINSIKSGLYLSGLGLVILAIVMIF